MALGSRSCLFSFLPFCFWTPDQWTAIAVAVKSGMKRKKKKKDTKVQCSTNTTTQSHALTAFYALSPTLFCFFLYAVQVFLCNMNKQQQMHCPLPPLPSSLFFLSVFPDPSQKSVWLTRSCFVKVVLSLSCKCNPPFCWHGGFSLFSFLPVEHWVFLLSAVFVFLCDHRLAPLTALRACYYWVFPVFIALWNMRKVKQQ